jgi:Matrixin
MLSAARRLCAVSIAAAAFGTAAQAHADDSPPAVRFGPGTQAESVARQIARDAWGGEPCGGQVTVTWGPLEASVNATSTWMNPTDPYANPSQNYDCNVEFNTGADFDWTKYCTVMVHEYGHLHGQQHSDDKSSVMYPEYEDDHAWPACESTADPTAPSEPSSPPVAAAQPTAGTTGANSTSTRSVPRSRVSARHRTSARRRASTRRASTRRAATRRASSRRASTRRASTRRASSRGRVARKRH